MTTQEIMADFCAKVCNATLAMECGTISEIDYLALMTKMRRKLISDVTDRMEVVAEKLKKGGD